MPSTLPQRRHSIDHRILASNKLIPGHSPLSYTPTFTNIHKPRYMYMAVNVSPIRECPLYAFYYRSTDVRFSLTPAPNSLSLNALLFFTTICCRYTSHIYKITHRTFHYDWKILCDLLSFFLLWVYAFFFFFYMSINLYCKNLCMAAVHATSYFDESPTAINLTNHKRIPTVEHSKNRLLRSRQRKILNIRPLSNFENSAVIKKYRRITNRKIFWKEVKRNFCNFSEVRSSVIINYYYFLYKYIGESL